MLRRTILSLVTVLTLVLLLPAAPASAHHKCDHGNYTHPSCMQGSTRVAGSATSSVDDAAAAVPVGAITLVAVAGVGVVLLGRRVRMRSLN